MRALVLHGFCIAPLVHAVAGEIVDIPDGLYREMLARGSVAPAPPEPAAIPVIAPPEPVIKPKSKH